MDLITTVPTKRNTTVTVNGHTYQIGQDCIAKNVLEADAAKMLRNPSWQTYDPNAPKVRRSPVRGQMQLVDKTGAKLSRQEDTDPDATAAARAARDAANAKAQSKVTGALVQVPTIEEVVAAGFTEDQAHGVVAKQSALAAGEPMESADAAYHAAVAEFQKSRAAAAAGGLPPPPPPPGANTSAAPQREMIGAFAVPLEGEDWPDPTEEMPIEYLHKMADAYEVQYPGNIGAKKLIEKIKAEMYG